LLPVAGIIVAVVPLFVRVPDDTPFLSIFQQKDAGGSWTSGGRITTEREKYAFEIEQKVGMNEAGNIVSLEATLHAQDSSGQTKIYRRTRYFNERGEPTETVEETPTRTTKKGRGPTGKDKYQETVLSDTTPLLARQSVRLACHLIGAVFILVGIALLLLPGRNLTGHPERRETTPPGHGQQRSS